MRSLGKEYRHNATSEPLGKSKTAAARRGRFGLDLDSAVHSTEKPTQMSCQR